MHIYLLLWQRRLLLNEIDFYIGLPESEEYRVAEMIPFPKETNSSDNHPNDAQVASGRGPNLLKHQNTRQWRESEIPSANGFETWVLGLHKSQAALEVAKFENSAILMEENNEQTYSEFDPNDPDAYIALSMRQNAFLDQSLILANAIQKDSKLKLGLRNRGCLLYTSPSPRDRG